MAEIKICARYLLRYELRKLKQNDKRTGLIQIYSPGNTPMEVEADDALELSFHNVEEDKIDKKRFDERQSEAVYEFLKKLITNKADVLLISDEGDNRATSLAVAIGDRYPEFHTELKERFNKHIFDTIHNLKD